MYSLLFDIMESNNKQLHFQIHLEKLSIARIQQIVVIPPYSYRTIQYIHILRYLNGYRIASKIRYGTVIKWPNSFAEVKSFAHIYNNILKCIQVCVISFHRNNATCYIGILIVISNNIGGKFANTICLWK